MNALSGGFIEVNPSLALPRLPEAESIPKALTVEQARRIDAAAPFFGPMADALISVFLYAGLRRTEARMLEWSSVDPDGWIRFRGKRSRERTVPLHGRASPALERWRDETDEARFVEFPPVGSPSLA